MSLQRGKELIFEKVALILVDAASLKRQGIAIVCNDAAADGGTDKVVQFLANSGSDTFVAQFAC